MNLCLGTAQFGMDYGVQGDKKTPRDEVFNMLRYALANNINTFDTAPAYGGAEVLLGDFVTESGAKKIKIITKLSSDRLMGVRHKNYKKIIVEEIIKSQRALKTDKLDGYLLHDPRWLYDAEILKVLTELREEGYIGHIGVSVYSPKDALYAVDIEGIDYIQVPYNALDHRLEKNGFFQIAKKNNKVVYARSIFLQGLLTMNPDELPRYIKSASDITRKFQSICRDAEYDFVEGSIAYAKSNKDIDYLIDGANRICQLKEIVEKYSSINTIPERFILAVREEFSIIEEEIINPSLWGR